MSTTVILVLGVIPVLLVVLVVLLGVSSRRRGPHQGMTFAKTGSVVGQPVVSPRVQPAVPVVAVPAATRDRVQQLIAQGRIIQAVKEVRMDTGLGLREAKMFVDALKDGRVPPLPVVGDGSLADRVRGFKAQNDLESAIALVRAETGMTRAEAERFVAALE
ncbi:hypothetical protein Arub01_18140 [Actinomadura rubrobrunea]|uniref:Ribosomal protein L7/L12 C-terminal domain-containing protein n=1 Tax=Actinomadura rubrobrunea TaxID=115335 RepID=A0A9W6PTS7_9ACTN|nr:hypothetical protein [Actinomadura rubrobrunea]GLW63570.1 hypothetical protein Arub01_18140 [Actinomadura rubrobrunea]